VEQQHFARALEEDVAIPPKVREMDRPLIGFYGVIDERIDLQRLAQVAGMRPTWNWVMIGPILKIEERNLPPLPNIHYVDKQDYKQLPAYLKAFDVAMMPFVVGESTRFISPTKALEYMVAHKPLVSTPIYDVISLYGSVVRIAESPEEFVEQAQAALDESEQERAERGHRENELLHRYEWDKIAAEMHALIQDRLHHKLSAQGGA
jgi:UDP-galactopyranose mutase